MADGSEQIGQNEIEELLKQAQSGKGGAAPATPSATQQAAATPTVDAGTLGQAEIEALLNSGGKSTGSVASPASSGSQGTKSTAGQASSGAQAESLGQSEIEALLRQGGSASAPAAAARPAVKPASAPPPVRPQSDMELLLTHAQEALASAASDGPALPPGVKPFRWDDFSGTPPSTEAATLDLLRDVDLDLKIELGRTQMYLDDVLRLRKGSVVTLDKLAGDPVDIYVNGRLIARGEVLVLNDNFCVRVAELVVGERHDAA